MTLCPFCKESFRRADPVNSCPVCGTPHHSACWDENGNRCSIFRCSGALDLLKEGKIQIVKTRLLLMALLFHIVLNYTFHFLIPILRPGLRMIPLQDPLVVLLLEALLILTGVMLVLLSWNQRQFAAPYDSARWLSGLTVSCNALFLLGLLYYAAIEGWTSLSAAIYF